jgi:hypothetical protein
MKNLIAAVMILAPSVAGAWEFNRNPDRFPSVGFNILNSYESGDRNENDTPSVSLTRHQSGPVTNFTYKLGADVRLPINQSMTLTLRYDAIESDNHFTRVSNGQEIYKESESLSGYQYGIGIRFYMNGGR